MRPKISNRLPVSRTGNAGRTLFRGEVVAEQQAMWLGTVMLASRRSHVAMSAFGLTVVGFLVLLMFASYTRTARVNGWLVPDPGLVRVLAPQPGVLTHMHVREGDEVKKGSPLLLLSTELQSEALGDTRSAIVRRLQSRRDSMAMVRQGQVQLQARQAETLGKRLESMTQAQVHLEQQLVLLRSRMALAGQNVARQEQLYAARLVSVQNLSQAQDAMLQLTSEHHALERQQVTLRQDRQGLMSELAELPLRNEAQLAESDRNIATLEQELAETEARRQIVVTAPQDGTVSSIQAELGSSANVTVPLLSIIPANSKLNAQLFATSGAVGFVTPGQRVLLRYAAFPYQKFGRYEGTITSVSRAAISPAELPQQLAGLTSLYDSKAPIYRVTVALTRQTAVAYGKAVPLQPGMQLEADVLVEKRRLIEWVFDPLFTLTGKWRG